MPSVPLPHHQWPRGRRYELHLAAADDATEYLVALLSDGSIDIDQGTPQAYYTPLMVASDKGHSRAVRILLDKGANVSVEDAKGVSALHYSATGGHFVVCKMLVNAGADLEAATPDGTTPLYLAAEKGHLGVMSALIKAGANPDSRGLDGETPLYIAAHNGHMNAIKILLRANANPLLTSTEDGFGDTYVPLDLAARNGHSGVVRELLQQFGIKGCGGASGGRDALRLAAMDQHVDTMAVLMDAGVVDNGRALVFAIEHGSKLSMKFLLQQRKGDKAAYVNYRNAIGEKPLLFAFGFGGMSSPSLWVVRLLVDAGADTTSLCRIYNTEGELEFHGKPLTLASLMLRKKRVAGKDLTEEQLHRLEGIRRLLLQIAAVHAVSFLWPVDTPRVVATTVEGANRKVASSTSLRMMLPILRRRARRPRVLLANLFRHSQKES